jgi:hypothetical protein
MRTILSCASLVSLVACASGEWVKNSGQLADEPVLAQCSQQAYARTREAQMSNPSSVPAQEQAFFNQCMKELGYDYVPIGPGIR